MKTCPDFNGDGVVDKDTDDERQCPACGGLGFVPDDDANHEEVIKTSRDPSHGVGESAPRGCQSGIACSRSQTLRMLGSRGANSSPGYHRVRSLLRVFHETFSATCLELIR